MLFALHKESNTASQKQGPVNRRIACGKTMIAAAKASCVGTGITEDNKTIRGIFLKLRPLLLSGKEIAFPHWQRYRQITEVGETVRN